MSRTTGHATPLLPHSYRNKQWESINPEEAHLALKNPD
jgi:hypothetical protein